MAPLLAGEDVLRRLFAGVTEQTFEVELGIAEPPLIEYMVNMLLRFLRQEAIYRVRDTTGHRLTQVADMVEEAEHRQARPRREGPSTSPWRRQSRRRSRARQAR